jgi:hypothetical protein
VHARDDGVFDERLDKIWRFLGDDKGHQHSIVKTSKVIEQSGRSMTSEVEVKNPDGSWRKETWKMSFNPPTEFSMEVTSGPIKDTNHNHAHGRQDQGSGSRICSSGPG